MQAIVTGLGIILPCLNQTQLSFPKLARSYFQLLADLIEIFPDQVLAFTGDRLCLISPWSRQFMLMQYHVRQKACLDCSDQIRCRELAPMQIRRSTALALAYLLLISGAIRNFGKFLYTGV